MLAVDARSTRLGRKRSRVGGQGTRVTTACGTHWDIIPGRRKAGPYCQNSQTNTHFSSLAVCFPLWPLTKNCNHISQLARSLAEEDCWRLHKLLHSRRRLMFLLWLYQYCWQQTHNMTWKLDFSDWNFWFHDSNVWRPSFCHQYVLMLLNIRDDDHEETAS